MTRTLTRTFLCLLSLTISGLVSADTLAASFIATATPTMLFSINDGEAGALVTGGAARRNTYPKRDDLPFELIAFLWGRWPNIQKPGCDNRCVVVLDNDRKYERWFDGEMAV
jgi:hypothetical protein